MGMTMIFDQTADQVSVLTVWTEEQTKKNIAKYIAHYYGAQVPSDYPFEGWYDAEWAHVWDKQTTISPEEAGEFAERMEDIRLIVRQETLRFALGARSDG